MAMPRKQVTRAYRTIRGLIGRRRGKGMVRSARRVARSYRSTKIAAPKKPQSRRYRKKSGGATFGTTVSIRHRRGLTYERGQVFDTYTASGFSGLVSAQGQQGVCDRTYFNGSASQYNHILSTWGNSGTSMQEILTSRSLAENQYCGVRGTSLDLTIISATNAMCVLDMYFVRSKKDTFPGTGITTSPLGCWKESMSSIGLSVNVLGQKPYQPAVGAYWTIFKKRSWVLNPGQCVRCGISTKEHYRLNKLKIGLGVESVSAHSSVAGRTYGWIAVVRGLPGNLTTDSLSVDMTPAKVNIGWTFKAYVTTVEHSTKTNVALANALDPPAISGTMEVVNDDAGVANNVVTL